MPGCHAPAHIPKRQHGRATRALTQHITTALDPAVVAGFPGRRTAHVTITLRDGRLLTQLQPDRKGDPELPLSDADLESKLIELAAPVIGDTGVRAQGRALTVAVLDDPFRQALVRALPLAGFAGLAHAHDPGRAVTTEDINAALAGDLHQAGAGPLLRLPMVLDGAQASGTARPPPD